MPNYTTNLNLEKPLVTENYDVGVFNDNADIIDGALNGKLSLTGGTLTGNLVMANGKGIDFSASQSGGATSSLLDDYEEGTFTPILKGSLVAGTQTYSRQQGYYTKVGNIVTVRLRITITAKDGAISGDVKIVGLPFSIKGYSKLNISFAFGITMKTGYTVQLSSFGSGTSFEFISLSDGSWDFIPVSNMSSDADIIASATYLTD